MKKKLLAYVLCICMVLGMLPVGAFAEETPSDASEIMGVSTDAAEEETAEAANSAENGETQTEEKIASGTCGENLVWELRSDGCLMISGTGSMNNYYSETTPWYSYLADIKQVKVEEGVTNIGDYAFSDCSSLTSVALPDGLMSIGGYVFGYCSNLESIEIPDSVISIGTCAFYRCESLKSLIIPDSVTTVEEGAFYGCSSMESAVVGSGLTCIADYMFKWCESLKDVVIRGNLTEIGEKAFQSCERLEKMEIPDGVTSIGEGAFYECRGLEKIEIPDSVTFIGEWAFYKCSSLEKIEIPDSVTFVGENAFYECSSLKSAVIGSGLTSLPKGMFWWCTWLQTVELKGNVAEIQEMAFAYCQKMKTIVLANGVISIGNRAFSDCISLTGVVIPDSVTSIESNAFQNCTSLIIYANEGSYAESFAQENEIGFVLLDEQVHIWDEGEQSIAPTCTKEGERLYTCILCGETRTEAMEINASNHTWDEGIVKDNRQIFTCTGCGETLTKRFASTGTLPQAKDNMQIRLRTFSYLVAVDSGYMRVFYDGERVCIEYYDSKFNLTGKNAVEMELPVWGGFYAGDDAYYLVEGQHNTAEKNNAEVLRVVKYDRSWKKLGEANITSNPGLFGGEVRYIFDYGCVEMTEYNGTLYIVTGHQGYVDALFGQGHQGFLMIAVDEESMTGKSVKGDFWHSFAQYIENDDSTLYVLEQSDGSRCTRLSCIDAETLETTTLPVLGYGGFHTSAWAVACYASVDDMALSAENILGLGTSIDQSLYDSVTSDTAHNIYLTVTPKTDFTNEATSVKWITDYAGGGKCFLGAKLTKINEDRFMISWEEFETEQTPKVGDTLSGYVLHYLFVDGSGNVLTEEFTADAPISDCHPIVNGSDIVYYASNNNMVKFYTINAETGAFSEKAYRVSGEEITWEVSDGTLTLSGSGPIDMEERVHFRDPVSSCSSSYVHTYMDGDRWGSSFRSSVTKIVIDSGITEIPFYTFKGFDLLEDIDIPESVESIGDEAFANCSSLRKITIPSSVTSIGEDFLWSGRYSYDYSTHLVFATICCYSGSAAEAYAKENNVNYVLLDETSCYYGDVDLSGDITAVDALAVLQHVVKLKTFTDETVLVLADVDHDGTIAAADALKVLKVVVKLAQPELMIP